MVTPEVVGHIDPVCLVELKDEREAQKSTCFATDGTWLTDLGVTS
jgi:hypothetical protein